MTVTVRFIRPSVDDDGSRNSISIGEEREVSTERAAELAEAGYAEAVAPADEPAQEPAATPTATTTPTTTPSAEPTATEPAEGAQEPSATEGEGGSNP